VGPGDGLPAFYLGKCEVLCCQICGARLVKRTMDVKEKVFLQ
jgi:hypothetical protein